MRRHTAVLGLLLGFAGTAQAASAIAGSEIAQHIAEARIAGARVHLADSRGQTESPAHGELSRLNLELAQELVNDVAAGRLQGLESFAKAVEADRPSGRAAFAPAWSAVKAALRNAELRARVGKQGSRLSWLEWRIEAAMTAPGVPAPVYKGEIPAGEVKPAPVAEVRAPPPPAVARLSPALAASSAAVAHDTVKVTHEVPTVAAPQTYTIPKLEDGPAELGEPGNHVLSTPDASGPTVVVADFTENGYRTGAALAAADLLARALADTGRFRVIRATGGQPAPAPGVLVEAAISPIRAFASPNPYYGSYGTFGRDKRGGRRFFPYPYAYANDVTYSVDARVRVSDLATRSLLGEKSVSGFTTTVQNGGLGYGGLGGIYGYGLPGSYTVSAGGPGAQVVEQAMLDKRSGASRFVLDLLPVTGRVARVEGPRVAVIEVPAARGVHAGDRFVVLGPAGNEVAVLRAQEPVSSSELRVKVSGHKDDAPAPEVRPGDQVVSRGY